MPHISEYIASYLRDAEEICRRLDKDIVEKMVNILIEARANGGRAFFLGVGGSAGNCSHAVNDFRKIAGLESYAPTDNVSELTARTNDDGWETVFAAYLKTSRLKPNDIVFIFSVGGGNREKNISANIVNALEYAEEVGAKIIGVVGRDGGYTKKVGDAVVVIPTLNSEAITPHTEAFHAVVWHMVVSHPALAQNAMKWEIHPLTRRAVFIDRDGVINHNWLNPATDEWESPIAPDQLRLCGGALDGLAILQRAGFLLFLVSNQPSAAKGKCTLGDLRRVHAALEQALGAAGIRFARFFYAYGHPKAVVPELNDLTGRKPDPYFLELAIREHLLDRDQCWMIGDRDSDVECGQRAHLRTIQVQGSEPDGMQVTARPDFRALDLAGAAARICAMASS